MATFPQNNPHGGYDVTDTTDGLLAGKHLVVFKDNTLSCLSCHSEHHGRDADVRVQAAFPAPGATSIRRSVRRQAWRAHAEPA